jgi:hypothetical protein
MPCNTCGKNKCSCAPVIKYLPPQVIVKKGPKGDAGTSGITQIPLKYIAFVSKNGNDTTGRIERLDLPFLTLQAAVTALDTAHPSRTSALRVQVYVFPGSYTGDVNVLPFMDFYLDNAIIDGQISDNNVDFGASDDNVYTNNIIGTRARIYNQGNTSGTTAIYLKKPNTKFYIEGVDLVSKNGCAIIAINTKKTRIVGAKVYTENIASATVYSVALVQITDYTASIIEFVDCDIYNLAAALTSPIVFLNGLDFKNQTLVLINCRVANFASLPTPYDGSVIQIGYGNNCNAKIRMYNSVLYSATGVSFFVESTCDLFIKYYHSNMTNAGPSGSGSIIAALGSITVNAAVAAEF